MIALSFIVHTLAFSQRKRMTFIPKFEPELGQHREKISTSLESTRLESFGKYVL